MTWLNFAKYLLGVTFMSLLKNLLCKLCEGLLYGLAPKLDSWGPLHSILTRPKGKSCLLVIFSSLLSCPSSCCWEVSFPPGIPALVTNKSAPSLQAKLSWEPTIVLHSPGHRPDLHGKTCSFRTPMTASVCDCAVCAIMRVCVFSKENDLIGHYL